MKYSPVTGKSNYTTSPSIDLSPFRLQWWRKKYTRSPIKLSLNTEKITVEISDVPDNRAVSCFSSQSEEGWKVDRQREKRIQEDGRKRVRSNSRIRRTLNRRSGDCASCPAPSSSIQAAATLKLLHVQRGAVNSRELSRPKLFHVRKLESSASG